MLSVVASHAQSEAPVTDGFSLFFPLALKEGSPEAMGHVAVPAAAQDFGTQPMLQGENSLTLSPEPFACPSYQLSGARRLRQVCGCSLRAESSYCLLLELYNLPWLISYFVRYPFMFSMLSHLSVIQLHYNCYFTLTSITSMVYKNKKQLSLSLLTGKKY